MSAPASSSPKGQRSARGRGRGGQTSGRGRGGNPVSRQSSSASSSSHTPRLPGGFDTSSRPEARVEMPRDFEVATLSREQSHHSAVTGADEEDAPMCVLCDNPISLLALGKCNHGLCHVCALRLRVLCNNRNCPVCRTELPTLYITDDTDATYESSHAHASGTDADIGQWAVECETAHVAEQVHALFTFKCPLCPEPPIADKAEMQKHVRVAHQVHFCELCFNHTRLFPFEHKLYNRKDLATHRRTGGKTDAKSFTGHPECVFCSERFFDNDALLDHLSKKHERCHLCAQAGDSNQYFVDYLSLEQHFGRDHYVCEDAECKAKKFVAFLTALDLQIHEKSEHMGSHAKGKVRTIDPSLLFSADPSDSSASSSSARGGRGGRGGGRRGGGRGGDRDRGDRDRDGDHEDSSHHQQQQHQQQQQQVPHDLLTGPLPSGAMPTGAAAPPAAVAAMSFSAEEAFPTLGGAARQGSAPKAAAAYASRIAPPTTASSAPAARPVSAHYASSVAGAFHTPPSTSITARGAPALSSDAFPSLASTAPPKTAYPPLSAPAARAGSASRSASAPAATHAPQSVSYTPPAPYVPMYTPTPAPAAAPPVRAAPAPALTEDAFPSLGGPLPRAPSGGAGGWQAASSKSAPPPEHMPAFPSALSKPYTFVPPPEMKERNQALIKDIKAVLSDEQFQEFKEVSGTYRQGLIPSVDYFDVCERLFGDHLPKVLPELVALLPDLAKQRQLVELHATSLALSGARTLSISTKGPKGPQMTSSLTKSGQRNTIKWHCCTRCGQVLRAEDEPIHATVHSDDDFPSLGAPAKSIGIKKKAPAKASGGAWSK